MKRLSELSAGQKGIIDSFEKDDIFIKLMEMGCVPGEKVKVEQIAPLGAVSYTHLDVYKRQV